MKVDIKVPAVGESITEGTIAEWTKKNGDVVQRDEILLVLETDKASVEVVAEQAGQLDVAGAEAHRGHRVGAGVPQRRRPGRGRPGSGRTGLLPAARVAARHRREPWT